LVLLALLYTALEVIIPQQFPAHLGHAFIALVPNFHLHLAPIFGASVFSFITVLLVLAVHKRSIPHLIACFILLLINFLPFNFIKNQVQLPPFTIRIVQPNIGNYLKIDSEKGGDNSLQSVFTNTFNLSTAPARESIDLIIWPETSYPSILISDILIKNSNSKIPQLLQDIILKTNAELFIGGYDLKSNKNPYDFQSEFNTAFHFGKDLKLKNFYHKIHLIPFGEGLPFGPLNQFLSKYITNVSSFAIGEEQTLFHLENKTPFISAICYEILFPEFIRSALKNKNEYPQFLLNLTNDSWYGDTAEPAQHLFLAKWRSLEFNLPIIRSTNTGISTVIMADGSETNRLSIGEKNFLDLKLQFSKRTTTPYENFGYLNLIFLGIFLIVGEKILLSKDHVNE
jgi:apolipoprotein N-acyltransferase